MFAIRIDLLSGRYAATAYNDRDLAEWPPHPARLFSALVATWADGEPGTASGDAELAALAWLEQQSPPTIVASPTRCTAQRTAATVFVPVNDISVIKQPDRSRLEAAEQAVATGGPGERDKSAKQLAAVREKLRADTAKEVAVAAKVGKLEPQLAEQSLLERRARQPRTFPCAIPELPAFAFIWSGAKPSAEVTEALAQLAGRLIRLGHSSSMVLARTASASELAEIGERAIRFVVDDSEGELMIRWVGPGQTERLIRAHARHQQVEPRVLPARFVRYREGEPRRTPDLARGVFEDDPDRWIVYARISGARLPITSAAGLSRQFRRALMSVIGHPVPELVSGHRTEGAPSESPHLAVVPLPFVTGPHPDGTLLGIALVLPRAISDAARAEVVAALARMERRGGDGARIVELALGQPEPLQLQRVAWGDPRSTLTPRRWIGPSRRWASATPIALDRHPGDLHDADPAARARAFAAATASVGSSVERLGLPAPLEIDVVRSCVLPGTAKPRAYPRFPSGANKPQRVLVHVRLTFAEHVRGPLLIGAGRYQGLGLCVPVDGRDGAR